MTVPAPTMRQRMLPRLDPKAAVTVPSGIAAGGQFVTVDEILTAFEEDPRAHKRLAVVFTGGGARGAYGGGAVEALIQAFRRRQIMPDVICGASVGAINALCLFGDLMFPLAAPDPQSALTTTQSLVWRQMGAGGNGADMVVDKAWVVEYLSGKKPIPVLAQVEAAAEEVRRTWKDAKDRLAALEPDLREVGAAITSIRGVEREDEIHETARRIHETVSTIDEDIARVSASARALHALDFVRHPAESVDEFQDLLADVRRLIANFGRHAAEEAYDAGQAIKQDADSLVAYLERLSRALARTGIDAGRFAMDGVILTGALLAVEAALPFLLEAVSVMLAHIGWLFVAAGAVAVGAGVSVVLTDHLFSNTKLVALMQGFLSDAMARAGATHPLVIDEWCARRAAGERVPAMYLAATNLTADRLTVFAVDDPERVADIATDGTWVVDLTGRAALSPTLFTPSAAMLGDLLTHAVMTSSSVPTVFPPVMWRLDRAAPDGSGPQPVSHAMVDGGVIDNTPIDLGIFADATHIVSIELTPLQSYDDWVPLTDTVPSNLATVAYRSYNTAMDGSMQRSIADIVELNRELPADQRTYVYRLAPLIPATATIPGTATSVPISPALLTFDGVYNDDHHMAMNLFDWFMQGYVDVKGWATAEEAEDDPIVRAYVASPVADLFVARPLTCGNRFWEAGRAPLPAAQDVTAAGIKTPDRGELARAAAHR